MALCDQCGSSSRDSAGFCGGCGASISTEISTPPIVPQEMPKQALPARKPTLYFPSVDLVQPAYKSVWIAVLLAALFGPLGMVYSTVTGALVMFAVSVFLRLFVGGILVWLIWPVCIFWAAMAARP